jgi:hypothetical protein
MLYIGATPVEAPLWNPSLIPPELQGTPVFYQRLISPTPPSAFQCSEIAKTLQKETELLGCSNGSYVEEGAQSCHGWIYASEIKQTIVEG